MKFTVVRNPFDKVVSAYFFANRDKSSMSFAEAVADFEQWLRTSADAIFKDREVFSIDGEIVADAIIRYETLQDDFSAVCEKLSIAPPPLGRFKGGFRHFRDMPVSAFYSPEATAIVEDMYAFELDIFGYRMP